MYTYKNINICNIYKSISKHTHQYLHISIKKYIYKHIKIENICKHKNSFETNYNSGRPSGQFHPMSCQVRFKKKHQTQISRLYIFTYKDITFNC